MEFLGLNGAEFPGKPFRFLQQPALQGFLFQILPDAGAVIKCKCGKYVLRFHCFSPSPKMRR